MRLVLQMQNVLIKPIKPVSKVSRNQLFYERKPFPSGKNFFFKQVENKVSGPQKIMALLKHALLVTFASLFFSKQYAFVCWCFSLRKPRFFYFYSNCRTFARHVSFVYKVAAHIEQHGHVGALRCEVTFIHCFTQNKHEWNIKGGFREPRIGAGISQPLYHLWLRTMRLMSRRI